MKLALITFLGISMFFVTETKIFYHEKPVISWSDFKPVSSMDGPESAHIHYAINYEVEFDEGNLKIEIKCYMIKEKSNVIKGEETDYLLNHEQKHFDLQEVFARKIRKRYLEKTDYIFDNLQKDLNDIFNDEISKSHELQALYDAETDHSINVEKQNEWNAKISNWLKELDDYKEVNLNIKIE
jgi:hypothetical protein